MNYKLYITGIALSLGLVAGCNYKSSELEQCLGREQKTTQQLKEITEKAETLVDRDDYQREMDSMKLSLEKSNNAQKENLKLIDQLKTEYQQLQEAQELNCQVRLEKQETDFRRKVIGSGSSPLYYGRGSL